MVEAQGGFDERQLKMMRDVIRYIDTNQVQKIFRILGAAEGLPIDAPVAHIGGMTATMHAAAVGGNTVMTALLEKNPNLGLQDTTGRTALHYACRAGNHKTVRILLEKCSPEIRELRTKGGITPLMAAVQSGDINVVEQCLVAGCDPRSEDLLGQSTLFYARAFRDVNGQNMSEIIQKAITEREAAGQ